MMYFKKTPDPLGEFVAEDGTRYSLACARRIRTRNGVNIGYEQFASLESALCAWNLSPAEQEVLL